MHHDQDLEAPQPDGRLKFLRILGTLGLALVVLTLAGAALAPYAGRITDVFLHQTLYRQWAPLTLDGDKAFLHLSTPAQTVRSYYSALYHGDITSMERLTAGPFREQMRQRLVHASTAPAFTSYHSYVQTEMQGDREALVREKFHLFWQRGLRFALQREATDWQIVGLELLP